jgi:hypothetical protein
MLQSLSARVAWNETENDPIQETVNTTGKPLVPNYE